MMQHQQHNQMMTQKEWGKVKELWNETIRNDEGRRECKIRKEFQNYYKYQTSNDIFFSLGI